MPQQIISTDSDGTNALLPYGVGAQLNLGQNRNFIIRAEWEQTQSEIADRYDYLGLSAPRSTPGARSRRPRTAAPPWRLPEKW